jgi:tellurite resistance-related uncharacterized protein
MRNYMGLPAGSQESQGTRYDVFIRMSILEGWKHAVSYYNANIALASQNYIRCNHPGMQVKVERHHGHDVSQQEAAAL